nr:hypothetical protein [Variovorax boronicumulans]
MGVTQREQNRHMRNPTKQSPVQPHCEIARAFNDTFQCEATERKQRTFAAWCDAGTVGVYETSCLNAAQSGLAARVREQAARAEVSASGHTGYGSMQAFGDGAPHLSLGANACVAGGRP